MSKPFRLTMIDVAKRYDTTRKALLRQLAVVESWQPESGDRDPSKYSPLVLVIDGERLDDAMILVARPAIMAELHGRIASLDRDLEAMGVSVD